MNYMKQVAQTLGVEMEEEFAVSNIEYLYKFVDNGLLQKHKPVPTWHYDNNMLRYLLSGERDVIKLPKPILDDIEKEYLSNIVKPFRDKVNYIVKSDVYEWEFIKIAHTDNHEGYGDEIVLPCFLSGTMYKGMELDKQYSLEDLGL